MVYSKKTENLGVQKILVFLFLAALPFGQLGKITLFTSGMYLPLYLIDLIAFISTLIYLGKEGFSIKKNLVFLDFLVVSFFSLVISLSAFPLSKVLVGSLYLVRIFCYIFFYLFVKRLVVKKTISKEEIFSGLTIGGVMTSIFGLYQYIFYPDVRFLATYGWDDHYFRLIGTFLDPGFLGLYLVLTAILLIGKILREKYTRTILVSLLPTFLALLLTYSRSSYLAFTGGLISLAALFKKGKVLLVMVFFFLFIPLLPRPSSEGVKLERTVTVSSRFLNYKETVEIIKKNPVFGVGLNNLCSARVSMGFSEETSQEQHGCSSDSSFLFLLATTGFVGLTFFLRILYKFYKERSTDLYGTILPILAISLSIHSLFLNSAFYNFFLGWFSLYLAISQREGNT